MTKQRPLFVIALSALAVLLAACGGLKETSTALLHVQLGVAPSTVVGRMMGGDAVSPQGLPYDPSDGSITSSVEVHVYDQTSIAVQFSFDGVDTYTADPSGLVQTIPLSSGANIVNLVLPAGDNPYTFESFGKAGSDVVGYGSLTQDVSSTPAVMVTLKSVLEAAVLTPRYPTTIATPGQDLDLMLVVMANGHSTFPTSYLQVPIGDFAASYDPVVNGTDNGHSNRGIRVTVSATCSASVTVTGTVAGLVDNAGSYVAGNVDINSGSGYVLACPPLSTGTIAADLEPPVVSIDSYVGSVVTGTATDNYGIAKVQVYDGPILMASTDTSEAGAGVALITFAPSTNTWTATLNAAPSGGIAAVALDPSGNESSTADTLDLDYIYVDGGNSSDTAQDGSQAHPFSSIQAGIDAVNVGGTVDVAAGSYSVTSTINITKSIVLSGHSAGTVLSTDATAGYAIKMVGGAAGTTIDNLTFVKTDKTFQNIIYVGADDMTVSNNVFSGKFEDGDSDTSRAMELEAGATGIKITGNTIFELRQPAYINPGNTGFIANNKVYKTRGWVVDHGLMTFTGNTWNSAGSGASQNFGCDIALLIGTTTTAPNPYDPIATLSANNGGAVICDQR